MPNLRIAVRTADLRLPLRKAIPLAAQMGASGVELDARGEITPSELSQSGIRQIRHWLEEHNLAISCVSFFTRRGYEVEDELERRVAATKAAMTMAGDLGAPIVVNSVGRVSDDEQSPQWRALTESLADLCRHGLHVGSLLAARTGNEPGADLARLLKALPEGVLGIDFDPGQLIVGGHSPLEALRELGPFVWHVHARDAARHVGRPGGVEVPLGRGSGDFPALLASLAEHNYRGFFTVSRDQSENPVFEIGQAVKYLREI